MLHNIIGNNIKKNPFYDYWLKDRADIRTLFCELENSHSIGFPLGTNRECKRFHIDNVSQRLLVTNAGKGTEWLPNVNANYHEYFSGSPNEKIIKKNVNSSLLNNWI